MRVLWPTVERDPLRDVPALAVLRGRAVEASDAHVDDDAAVVALGSNGGVRT